MEDTQKELIKKMADHLIGIFELNSIQMEKEKSVREQRYADAAGILDRERELKKTLPTLEEMKTLRKLLD